MCTDANKELLIGYVYDELPLEEQRAFKTHLAACEGCRTEVAALRDVRDDLLAWAPPECRELPSSWADAQRLPEPMARLRAWAPAFALAAAAMLLLAVSASIANLEVRYDAEGLVIRTGHPSTVEQPAVASAAMPAVTAADLAQLEDRLRRTFNEPAAVSGMQPAALTSTNPQLTRDMRRLIEESERRVRQEMATRLLDIYNEWDATRRADVLRLQQVMNLMEQRTGVDLANQRNELNRLMLASQGQGQK